jgi:alcohol dehydrogenase class IV
MKIFTSKSTAKHADDFILAIGGGAIIDEAKIYAKRNNKHCIAIPTTGAGATETTHGVVWGKTKKNVKTNKPLTVIPPFKVKLSKTARRNTCYDIIGHLVDYLNVCSDNELIEVGIYMGKLIEQHPTNLTHPASYPLTLKGIPHGEAVGKVLPECLKKAFPL